MLPGVGDLTYPLKASKLFYYGSVPLKGTVGPDAVDSLSLNLHRYTGRLTVMYTLVGSTSMKSAFDGTCEVGVQKF